MCVCVCVCVCVWVGGGGGEINYKSNIANITDVVLFMTSQKHTYIFLTPLKSTFI